MIYSPKITDQQINRSNVTVERFSDLAMAMDQEAVIKNVSVVCRKIVWINNTASTDENSTAWKVAVSDPWYPYDIRMNLVKNETNSTSVPRRFPNATRAKVICRKYIAMNHTTTVRLPTVVVLPEEPLDPLDPKNRSWNLSKKK